MKEYKGKIDLRIENVGAKSEGCYAFLECTEGESLQLCREGQYPVNDPYFEPYNGAEVVISGTESHGWLIVETITPTSDSEPTTLEDPEPANK